MARDLRIAVVGCGQIADAHLREIGRLEHARVVAVSDCSLDLAHQAAARFGVPAAFDDLSRMLASASPDVVHVTTPPDFHFSVARECLGWGAYVYVEKPFTSGLGEARALVAEAEAQGLAVCLGEDQLFDPAWEECRSLVERGELGEVIHVEAYQGYDLGGSFGRLAADERHWVHRLRGGLLRNVISHALALAVDFIADPAPRVRAFSFAASPTAGFPTELRALVVGRRTSGSICFSSAARPIQNSVRVFGTCGSIQVDMLARTVSRCMAPSLPGVLARIELPFRRATEAAGHIRKNVARLWRFDLQYFEGMHRLFERFYESIRNGSPPPISHQRTLRLTSLLDDVIWACDQSSTGSAARPEGLAAIDRAS